MTENRQILLKDRNFQLLLTGETISNLGDQFTLIALPWLILKLTNDPLVLGTVLALAGIPRAIFMLIGGAFTDKFSPKAVMLTSNIVRFVNVGILSAMILTGNVTIVMVYIYSLIFGIADAFFMPSQSSLVTKISSKDNLQTANTFIMGTAQLTQFAGPAIVGFLIGLLDNGNKTLTGIGVAMLFDTLTFLISVITLFLIGIEKMEKTEHQESIITSIKEGITYTLKTPGLRYILLLAAGINFLLVGPFLIGIPVIAKSKLVESAAGYGIIMAMYGLGVLIGIILVGGLEKVSEKLKDIRFLLFLTIVMGLLLSSLSFARTTTVYCIVSFLMALLSGYVSVSFITRIQQIVPETLMGRIMSIITFCSMGLIPLSEIAAGAVVKMSVFYMFLISGFLFSAISFVTMIVPEVRNLPSGNPSVK